ncbi:hypothetical protein L218DRAFT_836769, partial [Marasmius fiardii PR-910]
HFWSHDKSGHTPLSIEMCDHLGLPLQFKVQADGFSQVNFPSQAYKDVHNWQVLRGFDPNTADFAGYLGFPIFQVP